jgi:PAS domain S-box-containing protein
MQSDPVNSMTGHGLLNLGGRAHLIELFPMAAYAVRAPDGVIACFNSRAAELWGRVPVIGDTDERFCGAYKLYHADGTHMAHCDTPVALALKTGASVHQEEVIIERPDGSRVTVSVHIDPIRDEQGTIVGVVNFFHDINERKLAERVTGLLAAIVDSSDDAIVSKNLDGVITSWNKAAERLFGYTAEEAIGQNITMLIPRDRRGEEEAILDRLRRGQRIDHFETVRVRKDGSTLDISLTISPMKDAAGHVVGASKVARDITERKRVERAIAEQARLLDLSFDAIFVRDAADRITYWNKGASQLYGYTSEEALGRVSHELLCTEFPEPLERIVGQLAREGRWTGELTHTCKEGRAVVVASRWVLDRNNHRNQDIILETNTDITQQKQSEKALRESEEQFRALANSLDMQVRRRTEELERRNLEVLQQADQLRELSNRLLKSQDDERRRVARELHDGVGQLFAAIGMNLSTLDKEKSKLSPEACRSLSDNYTLIEQAMQEIRTISHLLHPPLLDEIGLESAIREYVEGFAKRSTIAVDMQLAPGFSQGLPRDFALPLFRVVQESLTNIHRHSGSKTALVGIHRSSAELTLEIKDEGKGISLELQGKVAFGEGSGVGLRGMRERVRQLGGRLDVDSDQNGTRIRVVLPVGNWTAPDAKTDDSGKPSNPARAALA